MNEQELRHYLEENGYPGHIVRAGREGLIHRWQEFVNEVERGYEFGIEDYRNDLDIRGILRLIGAEEDLADADERFRELLTATGQRVWESNEADPWWDFGYPRNSRGALRRDLESAGLWQNE